MSEMVARLDNLGPAGMDRRHGSWLCDLLADRSRNSWLFDMEWTHGMRKKRDEKSLATTDGRQVGRKDAGNLV